MIQACIGDRSSPCSNHSFNDPVISSLITARTIHVADYSRPVPWYPYGLFSYSMLFPAGYLASYLLTAVHGDCRTVLSTWIDLVLSHEAVSPSRVVLTWLKFKAMPSSWWLITNQHHVLTTSHLADKSHKAYLPDSHRHFLIYAKMQL